MAVACVNKKFLSCFINAAHSRVLVPQRTGFFSSKKPANDNDAAAARKILSEESSFTTQHSLGMLKNIKNLDTKVGYKPPANVREIVQKLVVPFVGEKDWETASLQDPAIKYNVITRMIKEFKHDLPSSNLDKIKTVHDAIEYFETEVHETSSYDDMSKLDLPKNLHIQLDYLRFDPETDTMFNGRTAFPGSDTVVSSIKYKRKYKSIKTSTEKPGFINHYYGY